MSTAFQAMLFARRVHAAQQRKYTGNPYFDHLAEVAGIVSACGQLPNVTMETALAVSWLHDTAEDQGVEIRRLREEFGALVANGVMLLTNACEGSRAERQAAARYRLAQAPGWVQTIKCADIISNTSSVTLHDPKFAAVYLEEKDLELSALKFADSRLADIARKQLGRSRERAA